ncbi:ATP-binding protein [Spirosoma sp. KCTC 42546]|uniref:ATP-binding protein n=1 Tax=Spirosoma sp. KCTC 42546 TaxID=2520506 RepID=UPI00115B2ECD|nr:ATP-binding protein [Spirosoma sp. KCTC 42546]QDK78481.1 ATP-binding protein [Spirosoma sp. KCTC 42546]
MSANPQPLIATIYNPHNQSKEALIAGFIARKQKFERIFRDIRDAPMIKPEQHYLIQGIRGMGKTTLLLRIAYEIDNLPELRQRLIPIVFNEEEYGISSLADVWERTAQYLGETDASFVDLYETITKQYGQAEYEQQAFQTLIAALQQQNKKLLLLIDNIGDLLKKLDTQEEKRLREILLTTPELRLIGATSVAIEQVHDYTKPFYEFFKVLYLEGLNRQEAIDLFLKLGDTYHTEAVKQLIERQPGRIEAIRRLTGGVIRTMVLLFEILVENDSGSVFRDLETLLDRVTPLYKHRIDDLSAQQQKIVAALAQAWDAASTKEIAQIVRLESKAVSAQLTQLINNGVIEKQETPTKNHLYRLEERFFNIWYLMRYGRRTDQRVLWLVRFFEIMFKWDNEWMQEKIKMHLQAMEVGSLDPEAALYLTTAFAGIVNDEELEDLLSKTTKLYLITKGRQELANEIGYSRHEKVTEMLKKQQYNEAALLLSKFKNITLNVYLDLIGCYLLLNRKDLAEYFFIELMKYKNKLIQQLIIYLKIRSLNRGSKKKKLLGPYAIYGEFVSFSIDFKNLQKINITSSTYTLIAELLIIYFSKEIRNRKEFALSLTEILVPRNNISSILDIEPNVLIAINIIYLWNNQYNLLGFDITNSSYLNRIDLYSSYLKLLLAKKQYHTAYNYFQQEEWQLKDRFKPLYYATLFFLKDEYPTEYLRMGPELKETVDDILAEVAQMAIDYA